MGPKDHTIGKTRYLTYFLHFLGDKDIWVDQIPFAQPLSHFLKNTNFDPQIASDLIRKGESRRKDNNGVIHRLVIEEKTRPRRWGIKR